MQRILVLAFLMLDLLYGSALFEDKHSHYTIHDIVENPQLFKETKRLNYGFSDSTFWLKVTLHNESNRAMPYYLKMDYLNLSSVILYTQEKETIITQKNGTDIPLSQRPYPAPDLIFELYLEPNQTKTVCLKVKSKFNTTLNYTVFSAEQFAEQLRHETFIAAAFLFILLTLLVYNAFLFYATKERVYGYYLLYLIGVIGYDTFVDGYLLWFDSMTVFYPVSVHISLTLMMFFSLLFIRTLLHISDDIPKIDRYLRLLFVIILIQGVIGLFIPQKMIAFNNFSIYDLYVVMLLVIIIFAYRRKNPLAPYLLAGWSAYVAGALLTITVSLGLINLDPIFFHALEAGSTVEAIIFSLLLARRINLLNAQKLELQAQQIRSLHDLREKELMLVAQNRHAQMGEMLSMIAHQWRQPLNNLGLQFQLLKKMVSAPQLDRLAINEHISSVGDTIRHLSTTIDDFHNFFERKNTQKYFSLLECLHGAMQLIESRLQNSNIHFNQEIDAELQLYGHASELAQVLISLLNNAIDACQESSVEEAVIHLRAFNKDDKAYIEIQDNAGGIEPEILPKIFDAYFSTKSLNGTGIGLYMAKMIIQKSFGGTLKALNRKDGALFVAAIPLSGNHNQE